MDSKIGRKAKFVLIGERYYTGIILNENENSITIKDKFGHEVFLGKNTIVSMEVIE